MVHITIFWVKEIGFNIHLFSQINKNNNRRATFKIKIITPINIYFFFKAPFY